MSQAIRKAVRKTFERIARESYVTETKAEAILIVLRERFKKVPKATENAIRQLRDPIALDSWTAYAASCQSMDEFHARNELVDSPFRIETVFGKGYSPPLEGQGWFLPIVLGVCEYGSILLVWTDVIRRGNRRFA